MQHFPSFPTIPIKPKCPNRGEERREAEFVSVTREETNPEPANHPQFVIRMQHNRCNRCQKKINPRSSAVPRICSAFGEHGDALLLSNGHFWECKKEQHHEKLLFVPALQQIYGEILSEAQVCSWIHDGERRDWSFRSVVGKNSITQLAQGHGPAARGWDKEGKHGELPGSTGKIGGNCLTKGEQTRE